jgi:hypothetical protein
MCQQQKIIFVFGISFLISVFFSSKIWAQEGLEKDKYVKRNYMFIPWGNREGQISLNVGIRKPIIQHGEDGSPDVFGKPVTDRFGPKFLAMDDKRNFYFYEGKLSTIKKFDASGKEIASLITDDGSDEFSIQGDEIVTKTNHANKITVLNSKDLSVMKKIDVPKDQIDMFNEYRTQIKDGALVIGDSDSKEYVGKTFVYDEQKWNSIGKNKYLKEQKEHEKVSSVLEAVKTNWTTSVNDGQMVYWNLLKKDKNGDYYCFGIEAVSPYSGKLAKNYLVKSDASGKTLFQMTIHQGAFLSVNFWPVAVDGDGNIFEMWADEDGLHINEFQYINNENQK